jgi:cytochrome c oxidase subunit 2
VRRRQWVAAIATAVGVVHWRAGGAPMQRVTIKAKKFAFEPAEIRVAKDQPVTLVLIAADFPHGFALPDFGLRRDLVPGQQVELTVVPDRVGRFHMLCDNFCGEEHDKMSGWFIVELR